MQWTLVRTTLQCTSQYTVLHYTALHLINGLHCIASYNTMHFKFIHCWSAMQCSLLCTALLCTILHWPLTSTLYCTQFNSALCTRFWKGQSKALNCWLCICKECAELHLCWATLVLKMCTAREWPHCTTSIVTIFGDIFLSQKSCALHHHYMAFFVLFAGLDCFLSNWVGLYRFV